MSYISSDIIALFTVTKAPSMTIISCKHCDWRASVRRRNALARHNVAAGEMRRHAKTCAVDRAIHRWVLDEAEAQRVRNYFQGSQTGAEFDALSAREQAVVNDYTKGRRV